jgi:hypothetical protein
MMRSVLRQACSPAAMMRAGRALARRCGDAAQHHLGGSVAEQGRGQEHRQTRIVGTRAQRAQVDRQE